MGSSGGLPDSAGFSDDKKETSYVKEAFNVQYNWIALAGLLHSYARLLLAAYQQRQYVDSTDPGEIKSEIASLQRHLQNDLAKVQDINKKRIEILSKRLEKYQKLCENREVVDAQCAAV